MIKSITITNYLGDSIKLELTRPDLSGFIIKSITGLGPVKATINTTEVTTNDGAEFNSARLTHRNIVMNLQFMETGKETIEDIRQKTYKYFPLKKELNFLVETSNRTLETKGYVESNEPDIFSEYEGCSISIICPDSFFYSTSFNETVFNGILDTFEFPFENSSISEPTMEIGKIYNQTDQVVTYHGESEVGIILTIHAIGDVSDITIHNTGTREHMTINTSKIELLTGAGIIAGDTITIDTRKGNKSIKLLRNGVLTNILNCLEKGCNWFTLTKGDNVFAYVADSGMSNIQLAIEHKNVYYGV